MPRTLLLLGSAAAFLVFSGNAPTAPQDALASAAYRKAGLPVEQRVEDLIGRMTPQEKARMLAGSGWMESFPIERLSIPAIKMADGPMGVRNWTGSSAVTNAATAPPVLTTGFPASIGMASSWDLDLVQAEGRVIAQEVKALGRDMILAPTVNINRTPLWGRNFEGYGEDPYLAARMGVAYIRGVQGEGVIPSVKHFAANNEEFERHRIDESIELRTLHEIYFPAFRAAVQEAGVWAVMNAYQKVNGQYCAENPFLLTETLRKDWGFKGFVISDWGSTYSTAPTINAGMSLEMPGGPPMTRWMAQPSTKENGNGAGWLTEAKVMSAITSGEVKQSTVDDNVRGILRVMFTAGLFDKAHQAGGDLDTPEQRAVARKAATESMVLLRNEAGFLPLDAKKLKSVAVIGPSASVGRNGGGSSLVRTRYTMTPLDGIKEAAGKGVEVSYAMGAAMPGEESSTSPQALLSDAVALAKKSDVAVVVVGYSSKLESEGFDRVSMDLPAGQDDLIKAVGAANKNTVVVVVAGSPVTMTEWIQSVPGVLYAWYGGQEAGHAVGDLLFGLAVPSGKVPVTFPKRIEDSTAHGNYPGDNLHVNYGEGIYVGYRGFDKRKIEPLFPFGFGLSYTTFQYSGLKVSRPTVKRGGTLEVSLQVKNSGTRAADEVVQLYVRDVKSSLDRPEKELKGFRRVALEPGQTATVSFAIDEAALSFFDPKRKSWISEAGDFEVLIGASSRDIRLQGSFALIQ